MWIIYLSVCLFLQKSIDNMAPENNINGTYEHGEHVRVLTLNKGEHQDGILYRVKKGKIKMIYIIKRIFQDFILFRSH